MNERPALHLESGVGGFLRVFIQDVHGEAHAALADTKRSDATAVHDFRTAMKRWRASLRLLEPLLGDEALTLRIEARDLARELAGARDIQAALDALSDAAEQKSMPLPASSMATMRARLEDIKAHAETTTLSPAMRMRLAAALNGWQLRVGEWPLDAVAFADIAGQLAVTYRRARNLIPVDWASAPTDDLHELRQRVIEHRYQIDLVEPLWPRLIRTWVGEAQRLRGRLGRCQDISVLLRFTEPHEPLARWRSRLAPILAQRRAEHVASAERVAARLFAERPRAFRQRLEALWERRPVRTA